MLSGVFEEVFGQGWRDLACGAQIFGFLALAWRSDRAGEENLEGSRATHACGDVPCACSDGMDNDGDGLVDGFDPECTGPFDDDEATFATGIPGDNKDPRKL